MNDLGLCYGAQFAGFQFRPGVHHPLHRQRRIPPFQVEVPPANSPESGATILGETPTQLTQRDVVNIQHPAGPANLPQPTHTYDLSRIAVGSHKRRSVITMCYLRDALTSILQWKPFLGSRISPSTGSSIEHLTTPFTPLGSHSN